MKSSATMQSRLPIWDVCERMFSARQVNAGYTSDSHVIRDVSFELEKGEVLCLLGRNGAGKTSLLKTIMGLMPFRSGEIRLNGVGLNALKAHEIPAHGVGYVPQGRRLFAELTVAENLEIGLLLKKQEKRLLDQALDLFPTLRARFNQISGTLSGGEQQMLAMARALCLHPSLLLLDEPTEGLMPSMISTIRSVISRLAGEGVGVLLVEQRIDAVLGVADRVAFMENGVLHKSLDVAEVEHDEELIRRYIGIGRAD